MLAHSAVIEAPQRCSIETEELALSRVEPGKVIVATEASMVSPGPEFAGYRCDPSFISGPSGGRYPWRPGHCLVGKVVARGPGVRSLNVADRVLCFGVHASAQYYDVSERHSARTALPFDKNVPSQFALLGRFARVAVLAAHSAALAEPKVVGVFGAGLIGILTAAILRTYGLDVIVFGTSQARARRA